MQFPRAEVYPYIFCFISLCALSCETEDPSYAISLLKNKYSADVINYYYEVGLHSEMNQQWKLRPSRWFNDIHFFLEGDTIVGDRNSVLKTADEVNSLKLPIKMYETNEKEKANMIINFGFTGCDQYIGRGGTFAKNNRIHTVHIKICADSLFVRRSHVIHEEIIQALGLFGDSYAYPNSTFYERSNYSDELSEIDEQTLLFLYDSLLPAYSSLEEFEDDFGDILYTANGKNKLLNLVNKDSIEKKMLCDILAHGLVNDKVTKFTFPASVVLRGHYKYDHVLAIEEAIREINSVSENLKLNLVEKDSLIPDAGIFFEFVPSPNWERNRFAISLTAPDSSIFISRRIISDIIINYNDTTQVRPGFKIFLANHLYQAVCLFNTKQESFTIDQNNKLKLTPYSRKVLELYYNRSLPEGFSKEELQNVINELGNSN